MDTEPRQRATTKPSATVRRGLRRLLTPREALSAVGVAAGRTFVRRGADAGSGFLSDDTPVIIVGMHRSGTSLVARLLERAGMYVGGSWLDENHEALHFSRANRAMLGEGPYLLHDFGWTAPKTDAFIEARRGYAERAARDIDRFFAERTVENVWGWKDPRTCLTLPVWLSVYPRARIVRVLRDGRSVALSLADRDDLDPDFGLALWAHYEWRAERALNTISPTCHHTTRFEDLMKHPEEMLSELVSFCGLPAVGSLDALVTDLDRGRATARLSDPRLDGVGEHPLLARYGYT